MNLHLIATGLLLAFLGQAPHTSGVGHPWEVGATPDADGPSCGFPARIDLVYSAIGRRQFSKTSGKGSVCHEIAQDTALQVVGIRGTVGIHESGKRLPRGTRLIACDERFQVLRVDRPRRYASCPGAETGFLDQARIKTDRPDLPEGSLSVVYCDSRIARVNLDLGEQSMACNIAWRVDEPLRAFAA